MEMLLSAYKILNDLKIMYFFNERSLK